MFVCYLDDGDPEPSDHSRITCCAAYIGDRDGQDKFERDWRYLLLKHDLTSIEPKIWRQIVQRKSWSEQSGQQVLSDFYQAIADNKLLGIAVAVDTRMWGSLKARKKRLAIESAGEFSFQRLSRLLFDRLQSSWQNKSIALVFDNDWPIVARRISSVQQLIHLDGRAKEYVSSVEFSDVHRNCHLQAAVLLGNFVREGVSGNAENPKFPLTIKALPEATGVPRAAIFEYWDQRHTSRWLRSIEQQLASDVKPTGGKGNRRSAKAKRTAN